MDRPTPEWRMDREEMSAANVDREGVSARLASADSVTASILFDRRTPVRRHIERPNELKVGHLVGKL